MLSYEIIIHCICGKVDSYILDATRFPIAIIGRKDESLEYQHIGLCADTGNGGFNKGNWLSRTELYFAYDIKREDWVVGNGFPNEEYWKYDKNIDNVDEITKNKRINNHVYVFANDKLEEKLYLKVKSKLEENKGVEKSKEGNFFAESFTEIKGNNVFELNTIAGVGIFPVNDPEKEVIFYNNKKHDGISVKLLPKIPFHWYIEINNNVRNRKAIINNIEQTEYLSKYMI